MARPVAVLGRPLRRVERAHEKVKLGRWWSVGPSVVGRASVSTRTSSEMDSLVTGFSGKAPQTKLEGTQLGSGGPKSVQLSQESPPNPRSAQKVGSQVMEWKEEEL